jgi:hypothetical protein
MALIFKDRTMWINTLDQDTRQAVELVLYKLREKSAVAWQRSVSLISRPGDALPAGGEHFGDALKSIGISEFTRHLWGGASPQEAAESACATLCSAVKAWNAGHERQQHRDQESGSEHVQVALITVMTAIERAEVKRIDHEKA